MKRLQLNSDVLSFILNAILFSFLTAVTSMGATACAEDAKSSFKTISVSEANEILGKTGVIFLDVREPGELQSGRIPGAFNIPLGSVEAKIEKQVTDKAATIVVYCQGGRRSVTASKRLVQMGYRNVLNMDGGYKAWLKAGYPVQQIIEKR
jgi:rhodanese-related sulfurtransferase